MTGSLSLARLLSSRPYPLLVINTTSLSIRYSGETAISAPRGSGPASRQCPVHLFDVSSPGMIALPPLRVRVPGLEGPAPGPDLGVRFLCMYYIQVIPWPHTWVTQAHAWVPIYCHAWVMLRYRSNWQILQNRIIFFIVLSSDNTNCKDDIQLFHQLFDELSVHTDYH